MDIVIDTAMQPQIVNVTPQMSYMMPTYDQNNSISIATTTPMPQQTLQPLTF